MSDTSWKLLSVQDFLSRYSQAQVENSATEHDKATLLSSDTTWQKRTVQDFFASCQWSFSESQPDTTAPFSLGLSVQSYFQYFQWNAPVESLASSPSDTDTSIESLPIFDVQKFSDLF